MTFAQYIENPMGKHNAVFSARDAYRAQYMEKFDALYMREAGRIDRTLYYDRVRDIYLAHIKIPSETVENFYYDVVIKFYTDDNAERVNSSLTNYQVQFFSNDPAFIYTYLFVFRKLDMLITDLKSKCPKLSMTQAPTERNFYQTPGYVKSIYFAYILMSRTDMFLKSTYQNFGQKYSKSALLSKVSSGNAKMDERKEKESRQKAQKRVEKADKARIEAFAKRTQADTVNKHTKTVGTVNRIGGVKSSVKSVKGKSGLVGKIRPIGKNK